MKFRIEKDTLVIAHHKGAGYHIKTEFVSLNTDVRVTFDMRDLWFAPLDMVLKGSGTEALFAGNIGDTEWYKYVIRNFYGFNLPENSREIERIIVKKEHVKVIQFEEVPRKDNSQARREEQRMLKRMNQPPGGYLLPGHFPK